MEDCFNNLYMTKEEARNKNIKRYKNLFKKDSKTNKVLVEEYAYLLNEVQLHYTRYEFYQAVALRFVKQYIPCILKEYGRFLDEKRVDNLYKIMNGENIMIFKPGEAIKEGYINLDENNNKSGDDGAFAISELGIIGFTPDKVNTRILEGDNHDIIMNALRMEGTMIHETFHLLICALKSEKFYWVEGMDVKSKLTSGGTILNEGLVEMHAKKLANKYNLIYNPALDYFYNVDFCESLASKMEQEDFEQMVFNDNYEEILKSFLTEPQMYLYKLCERKKYLEKKNLKVTDENIIILSDGNEKNINK